MNRTIRRFSGSRIAALGPHAPGERVDAGALLRAVRRAGRTSLSEYESKQVLALHDIPCVETCLAHSEDEAVLAAAQLGFPVTLKLHSHTLGGLPAAGGGREALRDEAGVRQGWQQIRQAVVETHGRQHFLGVTVQPTVAGDGREFFLQGSCDLKSGPVLSYGLVRTVPPGESGPADPGAEIEWSTAELPAIAATQFDRLLENFNRLLAAHPDIREIDLRPLVIASGQLLGLGARILLVAP